MIGTVRRCRFCGGSAIVNLRYARLSLCGDHFKEYLVKRIGDTMRRYEMVREGDHVLVAVSGGKDSNTLLHILHALSGELKLRLTALHIDLGIGEYSDRSRAAVEKLVSELGVDLVMIDMDDDLGLTIPGLAESHRRRKACSICGVVKRYVMNRVAKSVGADRIATGHTLDDFVQYAVKEFLVQNWDQLLRITAVSEPLDGLAPSRIKPLAEVTERETLIYALTAGIPFYHEECPYSERRTMEYRIKEFMNLLESDHPGIKISFVRKYLKRVGRIGVNIEVEGTPPRPCKVCGMPASGDVCSFCKLVSLALGANEGRTKLGELLKRLDEASKT